MRNGSQKLSPNDPCWCTSGKKYKKCHQGRDLLKQLQGLEMAEQPPLPAGFQPVRPGAVSPWRSVPAHIVRPDYAYSGKPHGPRHKGIIKGPEQLVRMRKACRAAREVLDEVCAQVRPGIPTDELDRLAHEGYIKRGGYPSTLNYHGFPKSVCTSVNEVICHGIPDSRLLQDGDIVNVDVTIYLDGMHGDCSATVAVGTIDEASRRLMEITRECLLAGIGTIRPGSLIRDIGKAIEGHAHAHSYSVVRAFVGHGIGELFHMDPQVPHYYDPAATFECKPGMTFTVEPMINLGTWKHESWNDNWTAVTQDRKRSAQYEHTILVTDVGVEILTLGDGEAQPFRF
jgi:methionyl aminopeptidase